MLDNSGLPKNDDLNRLVEKALQHNGAVIECMDLALKIIESAAYWSAANSDNSRAVPLLLLSQQLEKEKERLLMDGTAPR